MVIVNLKDLRRIKDIRIVKHVMFDCCCQNASSANARFEIMMRRWRLLMENGVRDVSFVLLLFSFSCIGILMMIYILFFIYRPAMNLLKTLFAEGR